MLINKGYTKETIYDFKIDLDTLKTEDIFVGNYKHSYGSLEPSIYENQPEMERVEEDGIVLYGLVKSALSLALSSLVEDFKNTLVNPCLFDLDQRVSLVTETTVGHMDTFFTQRPIFTLSFQKIVTKLLVEVRCFFLEAEQRWLDFFNNDFWIFLELGINRFMVFKEFIFEDILKIIKKFKLLSTILETNFKELVVPWLLETVEIVSILKSFLTLSQESLSMQQEKISREGSKIEWRS